MSETESEQLETLSGGELVYRATEPAAMSFREEEGATVIEGRMMPYGEWTEVRSRIEGHFLERFAAGSLAKTMVERATKIRAMWEHGLDNVLGRQTIADIDELRDEPDGAYYRATLLDGIPKLLVSGLRRGLYGSSVRFEPIKWDRARFPKRSEQNPLRLPEHTIREALVKEFSITPFPVYAGATARVRSLTDEIAAKQLLGDPVRLLEFLNGTGERHEPPHSEREEPHQQAPAESRRTQPAHDYLRPEEDDRSWML